MKALAMTAVLSALCVVPGGGPLVPTTGDAAVPAPPVTSRVLTEGEAASPVLAPGGADLAADASQEVRPRADLARRVFDLTNERRRAAGRAVLLPELDLERVATDHSRDMLRWDYFGHVSPVEGDFERRLAKGHRTLVGLGGENVWKVEGNLHLEDEELAQRIVADWMSSPGHRENLLRKNFTHLGIGICEHGNEIAATQMFAQVRAYLPRSVPRTVRVGEILDLRARGYGVRASDPKKFDLWSMERDAIAGGPFEIPGAPVTARPGTYLLRLYFRNEEEGRWTIYPGPAITVAAADSP